MESKLQILIPKYGKFMINVTRFSAGKVGTFRYRVPKTQAYLSLTNVPRCKWLPYPTETFTPQGCYSVQSGKILRTLHLGSSTHAGSERSYAKASSDQKPVDDNESRSTQRENLNNLEKEQETQNEGVDESENAESKPQGLLARFRQTYKKYGKVLIGVHVFTSCIWGATFYYAAASGVDVVPLLEWMGASEKIIKPFTVPSVGHVAVAYLLYKLATPLRYTVTIGGTRVAVNVLRRWGYLQPIPKENRIRSLVKEGRQKMKQRYDDIRKTPEK